MNHPQLSKIPACHSKPVANALATAVLVCSPLACGDAQSDSEKLGQTRSELKHHRSASNKKEWPLAGYDLAASGFNAKERKIKRRNVDRLAVDWTFDASRAGRAVRPIHATPVVSADGTAYVGDLAGVFFAIDRRGRLRWAVETDAAPPALAALVSPELGPIAGAPIIGGAALAERRPYVVFADAAGEVYARHRRTGEEIWTARGLDPHPVGGVAGNSVSIVGDTVLVGMASLENFALVLQGGGVPLECCTHQGALVALDLNTGQEKWRYEVSNAAQPLPPEFAPFTLGPSGADVWSQPTFDRQTRTVFVSTGQNFSPDDGGASTSTSDAIIAIDFDTGQERWVHQFTADDIWVVGITNPDPDTGRLLDMDVGDAPKLYELADGTRVVGAGQKDGRYHVLNRDTGELVRTTQHIEPRNALGGFQTGGAVAYGRVFQHGIHTDEGPTDCEYGPCAFEGFEGRVMALSATGEHELWSLGIAGSPLVGGLAVANRLLYFQSPVEEDEPLVDSPKWALYVLDALNGDVLRRIVFDGRAVSSPVVAGGHVYVAAGNGALPAYGVFPEGSLTRLGVR